MIFIIKAISYRKVPWYRPIYGKYNFYIYVIQCSDLFDCLHRLFLHDPEVHENPEEFRPERFVKTDTHEPERDPRQTVFGFGRRFVFHSAPVNPRLSNSSDRICPGLNIAELSIFISCAMFLSVFDISKTIVDGVEITPTADVITGIIT